jgi:hypothetical protein
MTNVEKKASTSNESLSFTLTNYLESIIAKSTASKPIDLLKKDLISYFDNIYDSLIKNNQKEKIEFSCQTIYNNSLNYGGTNLTIYPDKKISLIISIVMIGGERMTNYLNGKLIKTPNGIYQITTNEGVFNVQFIVDQCGVKSIQLSGTGRNSTIQAKLKVD